MAGNSSNGTFGSQNGDGAATILDQWGKPWRAADHPDGSARPGGIDVPHVYTFIARYQGADNTYLHGRFDEALRRSREDAEVMRRDAHLMALLQERQLAVTGLNWHLEVPDDKDKTQARVRDGMTRIVKGITHLRWIMEWLMEALWFGRHAAHVNWAWGSFMDRPGKPEASENSMQMPAAPGMPLPGKDDKPRGQRRRCLTIRQAWPVNGDKIGYQHDHTPYVLIAPDRDQEIIGHDPTASVILTTAGGRGLSLRGGWRERFIIHKHLVEDVDYFNAEQADAIHGVGIRSKLFWYNWLKLEWLSNISDFFDKVGLGMTLWKYPAGNEQARQQALAAAREQSSRTHLLVPVWGDTGKEALAGVDRVEVPTAGGDSLARLIEYVDRAIERYMVGQTGSSRPGAAGIGNAAASEFMQDTKSSITKRDANMLATTMTGSEIEPGVLSVIQKHTFPWADFPVRWAFEVGEKRSEGNISVVRSLLDTGLDVKVDDLYAAAGFSKPAEGDEVIRGGQQQQQQQQGGMGVPGQPGTSGMGQPGGMDPAGQQAPPSGGDFLQALQMSREGAPLRYNWQQGSPVGQTKGGEPLFDWYDPQSGEHRRQHAEPYTGGGGGGGGGGQQDAGLAEYREKIRPGLIRAAQDIEYRLHHGLSIDDVEFRLGGDRLGSGNNRRRATEAIQKLVSEGKLEDFHDPRTDEIKYRWRPGYGPKRPDGRGNTPAEEAANFFMDVGGLHDDLQHAVGVSWGGKEKQLESARAMKALHAAQRRAFDALPGDSVDLCNTPGLDGRRGVQRVCKKLPDGRFVVEDGAPSHDSGIPRDEKSSVFRIANEREVRGLRDKVFSPGQAQAQARGFSQLARGDLGRVVSVGYGEILGDDEDVDVEALVPGSQYLGGGLLLLPEGGKAAMKAALKALRKGGISRPMPLNSRDYLKDLYAGLQTPERHQMIYGHKFVDSDTADEFEKSQPLGRDVGGGWTVIYDDVGRDGNYRLMPNEVIQKKSAKERKRLDEWISENWRPEPPSDAHDAIEASWEAQPTPHSMGGDFLTSLRDREDPLQYDWANMGLAKVSPSGLPLYRWWDPNLRQARVQHVKPGEGKRGPTKFRGKGPGRTKVAQLDAGPRAALLIARLLKLMFPGGWVKPSGLPALVGAAHGTAVAPYPRREPDGTVVIELRPEGGDHWELSLSPEGHVLMDPPEEPSEQAVLAMAVAGIDASGGQALPLDDVPREVLAGNARRRKQRLKHAEELMQKADALLPRPEPEDDDEEEDGETEMRDRASVVASPPPAGRVGEVLRHLRATGRHAFADEILLAYQRRVDGESS